jgi:CRISPR-associated protein (TIGR02584 family)
MSTPKPQSTTRRILLAVTGLTPQVVTETLYALACSPQTNGAAWVPDEVHLVTTATGAENARLNLLQGERWFHRLREDYELPPIEFSADHIHVLQDGQGQPLDDIRTQAHNTCAADFITELVRRFTSDPASELHVSIAGGRKTMGYYLGYALSLYGRAQDRLSHVLVSDPYETNRQFYYPTPYDFPIHVRRGEREITVDARYARVDLAEIPFVRLREGLPARLVDGVTGFSEAIARANRGLEPPLLRLCIGTREVYADETAIDLSETEFLVMLWLAERLQGGGGPNANTADEEAAEFLGIARRVLGSMSARYEEIETAIRRCEGCKEDVGRYFQPHKSRINKSLERCLGARPAARYQIAALRSRVGMGYYLPLSVDEVVIES